MAAGGGGGLRISDIKYPLLLLLQVKLGNVSCALLPVGMGYFRALSKPKLLQQYLGFFWWDAFDDRSKAFPLSYFLSDGGFLTQNRRHANSCLQK